MIIGYRNNWDDGTVTVSNAVAGFPANFTQNAPVAKPCRVSSSQLMIDFDYGANLQMSVRAWALLGTNCSTVATIRIQQSDTSPSSGEVLDTGFINAGASRAYPQIYNVQSADKTSRFARITLVDSAQTFIDVGRIFAGPVWVPAVGENTGRGVQFSDASDSRRTTGGQLISRLGARFRAINFVLQFETEATMMANAFELDRIRGITSDILVIPDLDNFKNELSIFGPVTRVTPLVWWAGSTSREVSKEYVVEERL